MNKIKGQYRIDELGHIIFVYVNCNDKCCWYELYDFNEDCIDEITKDYLLTKTKPCKDNYKNVYNVVLKIMFCDCDITVINRLPVNNKKQ